MVLGSLIELCYYWFHRVSHEIGFIWAMGHANHHSSEHFNFSTSYRVLHAVSVTLYRYGTSTRISTADCQLGVLSTSGHPRCAYGPLHDLPYMEHHVGLRLENVSYLSLRARL